MGWGDALADFSLAHVAWDPHPVCTNLYSEDAGGSLKPCYSRECAKAPMNRFSIGWPKGVLHGVERKIFPPNQNSPGLSANSTMTPVCQNARKWGPNNHDHELALPFVMSYILSEASVGPVLAVARHAVI